MDVSRLTMWSPSAVAAARAAYGTSIAKTTSLVNDSQSKRELWSIRVDRMSIYTTA